MSGSLRRITDILGLPQPRGRTARTLRLQTRLLAWTSVIVVLCIMGTLEIRTRFAARLLERELQERTETVVHAAARALHLTEAASTEIVESRLREFVEADPSLTRLDVLRSGEQGMEIVASSSDSSMSLLSSVSSAAGTFVSSHGGGRDLIVVQRVEGTQYCVVAQTSLATLDTYVSVNRIWAGIFSVVMIVLVISMMHLMFRRIISKRFDELLEGIYRAKKGNRGGPIPVDREDEIGIIASTFNSLLDQVQSFNDVLQRRVAQATESLDRRNKALEETSRELVTMQRQLLKSERLATVGQMAATFAHEIGSPMSSLSA
ncbi:MAG: HAMP domain-containing protein, partial [Acidobacteriota bacterium]